MQVFLYFSSDQTILSQKIEDFVSLQKITSWNRHDIRSEGALGIDTVREIKSLFTLKAMGENRLVIVHCIEKATMEAQQALLKLLEEPPKQTFIILTTDNPSSLLPTIMSRVQVKNFTHINTVDFNPNESIQLVKQIVSASKGERIVLAGSRATSKEDAIHTIKQIAFGLHQLLNQDSSFLPKKTVATLLTKSKSAISFLEGNVNFRATIDIFFLGFPTI